MASIQKKNDSYYIVLRVDGKQKWIIGGKRKKDAERVLVGVMGKIHRGEYQDSPEITLKELADKWLELKQSEIRSKTFASYEPQIRRIIDAFGDRKVKSINQEMLEIFISGLSKQESPDLVGRIITHLKTIFRKGVQWGYIYKNPAEFLTKPKAVKREMDFLTPEELKALLGSTHPKHRCLMMLGILTGCRQSEILGLKWEDVDFNSSKIYIRQVMHGGVFYEPKTEKSKRAITVPSSLIEELRLHQLNQLNELKVNEYSLVFPNTEGRPMDGRNLTRRVLEPALRIAGIRKVGFHALRHSYVSMLVNQGENIRFIQKQVGHSSAKITWDVYSHLMPESEQEAVDRLENNFLKEPEEIMSAN